MLLSYPVLKNPVNLEAAQLLIRNASTYKMVIQELLPPALPSKNCFHTFPWQLAFTHETFKANK
jgi:hypothetical protein